MRNTVLILSILFLTFATGCRPKENILLYADPFVGTSYTGHTFPGAAAPLGAMQPGPQSGNYGWEYCSGYVYEDPRIQGFSQNRLSGTGIPDLGDLLMMPFSGELRDDISSAYDKASETAHPGYYAVTLTDNGVHAEMTATPHTAFHRYTFDGPQKNLYIDFQSAQVSSRDQYATRVKEFSASWNGNSVLTGSARVRGWVERELHWAIEFDAPVQSVDTLAKTDPRCVAPRLVLRFEPGRKPLNVKVSISTVDVSGAVANIEEEVPGWNFDAVRSSTEKSWLQLFERCRVEGTEQQKKAWYTSLYHLYLQPADIADCDGRYRGADDKVASSEGPYYSTLSQWDTFRAADPFYALFTPDIMADLAKSMIGHADAIGFLPIWALWGKENYCMIGNHGVPPVVDAALKGLIDPNRAWEAVRRSLTVNHYRSEWDIYDRYGYFPFDLIRDESVSRTLECGYDDWCAARLARHLGLEEDAAFFEKRAAYWKNLFDEGNKLLRGRDTKGQWRTPFDKFHLSHGGTAGGDYTEGNAWQYSWHVLQDPRGLIDAMGGQDAFRTKLDSLFTISTRVEQDGFTGDVTGLIGQYAHGNEPSHHVAYLYTLAGAPDRTAEVIREVFDRFYMVRPDGLCGNDDCGQMSAWYLFSALGFYPLNPVSGEYVLGAPQVPGAVISLPGGKTLRMVADGLSENAKYVRSATWNGNPLGTSICYEQLLQGGELRFAMTEKPNESKK